MGRLADSGGLALGRGWEKKENWGWVCSDRDRESTEHNELNE